MRNGYVDWLSHWVIAERQAADPEALRRSLLLLAGMLSRLDETPSAQALLRSKLASLPLVQQLVADDAALLSALNLPLETTRAISASIFASAEAYADAVVRALRGQSNVVLTDTDGHNYAVRLVSFIGGSPPYPTVAFLTEDGSIFVAADFRLQLLILNGEELQDRLTAYRADLELSLTDLRKLGTELEGAEPAERLNILERLLKKSTTLQLLSLERRIVDRGISAVDLEPPQVDGLVRYIGGLDPKQRVTTLLERFHLGEVIARLSTIPAPIPREVMERFDALERYERRNVFRMLRTRCAGFVPTMHQLVFLLRAARSDTVRMRLLSRSFGRLVQTTQVGSMIEYCAWAFTECNRRPSAGDIPVADRLTATWTYASEIANITASHGIELADLIAAIPSERQWERYVSDVLEDAAPSSPLRISVVEASVRFIGHIIAEHRALAEGFHNLLDATILRADSPWPLHIDLYLPLSSIEDPIHSLFEEPMEEVLMRVVGSRFTLEVRESLTLSYATTVVREKMEQEPLWWHFLRRRTRGGIADPEFAAALNVQFARGAAPDLMRRRAPEWRARLITLAQVFGASDPSQITTLLADSLTVAEDAGDCGEAGMASLLATAAAYRHLATRKDRLDRIIDVLERFAVSKAPAIRSIASRVGRTMRDRLAAREVDPRISGIILLGRRGV